MSVSCDVKVEQVPWCDGKNRLDDDLPLVPGDVGQAAQLDRGRSDLPDILG